MPSSREIAAIQSANADAFVRNRLATQIADHPAKPYILQLSAESGNNGLDKDLRLRVCANVSIDYLETEEFLDGRLEPVLVEANERNLSIRTAMPRFGRLVRKEGKEGKGSKEGKGEEGGDGGSVAEGEGEEMDTKLARLSVLKKG
ncbi:hypothetical protein LTR02_004003 [Friedmanniomyces endolithicus]|uniref:Uncharacterized protein n=1 Tax=Rachicladosporium monterosium TaxID=1507873 RepID=A0ABR0L310_9PEZI|nr:hypothetical protein LTS09_005631 [Friedmanniomyces endolithicus]KAK5142737.1 hypothetical protein LTR32_004988 [Rachicladosporium monterosium]KAK0365873.1 hypothetical protein LTR94_005295 [Friedmanniomyces endolithicus]KAK0779085.1 hypothetical protein LTR38_014562 [Friedmanniomyces endolithicus]KAK0796516.1 hypothetical protein LTR75_010162 [Friedmanniomyces endolithicus]